MQPEYQDELDRILEAQTVTAAYQPLVSLTSGRAIGFEALARGPAGSPLERPDRLFAAAREANQLRRLDWMCRTAAVRGALEARLRPPLVLFVNSEPETIGSRMPVAFAESWGRARLAGVRVMFEVTERAVMDRPAQLLRAVDQIRGFGWGVALDDVGTNPASLALLPFLDPDVIKLDMSLLHGTADDIGEVILAVNAEVERTGAALLAEGIENEGHLALARAFGATLGQGWLFGRPGPLPELMPPPGDAVTPRSQGRPAVSPQTPYEIIARKLSSRRLTKPQLEGASRIVEQRAARMPHPPLLVATFQHVRNFTGSTKAIYEDLARRLPFVAALAVGWEDEQVRHPRRVALDATDPLAREWAVGIITPFSAMFLVGRERDEGSPVTTFDVVMTFDRDLAIEAADSLLRRLKVPDEDRHLADEEVEFAAAVTQILAAAEREQDLVRPLLKMMSQTTGLESTFLSRVDAGERYEVLVSYNRGGGTQVDEGYSMPWAQTICHDALVGAR
ncbi:MAG: EAL domain-containing protein, partial [Actinomycetota bacterium]|nr:EAL domain-containing protein [Actinomycetota bacterium]